MKTKGTPTGRRAARAPTSPLNHHRVSSLLAPRLYAMAGRTRDMIMDLMFMESSTRPASAAEDLAEIIRLLERGYTALCARAAEADLGEEQVPGWSGQWDAEAEAGESERWTLPIDRRTWRVSAA
jgi:hypothetical protein